MGPEPAQAVCQHTDLAMAYAYDAPREAQQSFLRTDVVLALRLQCYPLDSGTIN